MHRPLAAGMAATLVAGTLALAAQPPASAIIPDAAIQAILRDRIDRGRQSVGIVVGVIEPGGRRVVAHGLESAAGRPVGRETVYEIGSITKVFTSLLLAIAVERGEVTLSDPVVAHLPNDVKVPERAGRTMTLQDLANHTSALPRLPTNLMPANVANPYADYSVSDLYRFVSSVELPRDIGSRYEYSNLGVGLLGHVLARRAGLDYETLVRTRIAEPLGMQHTTVTLTPAMRARAAAGHDASLKPVPYWDIPTLAGAGALRSNADDMLTLLEAFLGYRKTPLASAMSRMLATRWPTGTPNLEIGLGWHVFTARERAIAWHNGGTAGFRTFTGFDAKARTGVVVLSNAGAAVGQDDLGRHLLDPASPLRPVETAR